MNEAEFAKFSVSLMGQEGQERKRGDFSNLNYKKLCRWISSMQISEDVKNECLKLLKKYPHSALKDFVKNFQNIHLRTAQANVRKKVDSTKAELGDEDYVPLKDEESFRPEKENEELPEVPKIDKQTDFFPETK